MIDDVTNDSAGKVLPVICHALISVLSSYKDVSPILNDFK